MNVVLFQEMATMTWWGGGEAPETRVGPTEQHNERGNGGLHAALE